MSNCIVRLFHDSLIRIAVLIVAGASFSVPAALARVCDLGPGTDANDSTLVDRVPAALPVSAFTSPADDEAIVDSDQQSSSTQGGAGTDSNAKQAPTEHRNADLGVNPLTGLVTTTGSDYQPLTGKERWKIYWKMNFFSVGAYFGPFFDALLLDQATSSPYQWGGGFKGYGRRVASRTADAILQGTLQAPFAAALHEDVRYIASTQRSYKRRAFHAIIYSFVTYTDSGHPTPNIANLSAYYGSTAISTVWLPGHYNWASYALSNSTEQIALTMPVNLIQEFWPEVRHFVLRRQ